MDLEVMLHVGPGGFASLTREEQERWLAWLNVSREPEPKKASRAARTTR